MPDVLMYDEGMYMLLEPNQPEQFLTPAELLEKLKAVLAQQQDHLPPDLQDLPSLDAQAKRLLDTACELNLRPGEFLQWYAVRLEK
jgi:hypothetical protein